MNLMFFYCFNLLFVSFSLQINAEFNKHFANFIVENYGKSFLDILERKDLGPGGSFGGRTVEDEEINRDPVIFVHGVSDIAEGKMQSLAEIYRKQGYSDGELYSTTYASGAKNNPVSWAEYSLKCSYVKQIRTLLLAVRYYTLRNVDVIAYSLGVPIARKAILGGICVDTKENIGMPLTDYIDTFVGIAGPNHGISLQIAGVSFPGCIIGALPIIPICSKSIGLYSGLCPTESVYLMDINEKNHYEGTYVYSVYTEFDKWIGYKICNKITAKIPGENGHASYKNFTHDSILLNTWSVQFNMIENHSSQDLPINKKQNKKQNVNESESENEHEKRKKIQSRSLRSRESSQKKSRVLSRQITSASPIDNDFLQTTVKPVKSTTLNSQVTDTYHSNNIVNSHGMQEKHIITTMETAQEADFIADKGEGYHTRFQISLDKQNK